MNEIWKDIYFWENGVEHDYKNLYQISNFGRVKSLNYKRSGKEKILKAVKNKFGYELVDLCKNGETKHFRVHRLVAHIFIENDNPIEKIEVNHIDENKTNNHVSNLEWCTREYNNNYGTRNERAIKSKKNKILSNDEEIKQKIKEVYKHQLTNMPLKRYERHTLDDEYIDMGLGYEYERKGYDVLLIHACVCGILESYDGYKFKLHPFEIY